MVIKIWDKYKIKSAYRETILETLQNIYENNINSNIVNKVWEIYDISEIYFNRDLSSILDEVMLTFKHKNITIWMYLSEVIEYKEKNKLVYKQPKLWNE